MTATRVNEHRALAARFSAAAGTYERHASVQEQAAARVAALLADTPGPARILELGCGTGVLTRRLSRQFPRARIEAFDVAPGMVARCRARLRAAPNVRCAVADWTALPPALRYPLIVSSSALHWMHPLPDVLRALAARLAPGGRLVVAVMLRGVQATYRIGYFEARAVSPE